MSYDPTFSTRPLDVNRNKIVYVETINAFPDPVSGEITLPDNCPAYIWTGELNSENIKVIIPDTTTADVSFAALNGVANAWTTEITTGETLISSTEGRRLNFDSLEIASTNGGTFIDIESSAGTRPLLAQAQQLISGFDKIGTINGMLIFSENIGYVNNADGITYVDLSSVTLSEIIFVLQRGNHITLEGDLNTGSFNNIEANPETGDAVFDIDSSLNITNKITIRDCPIYTASGGTMFDPTGLDQTDPRVICFNNGNELDSYWIGSLGFKENSTTTTISVVNTYVDISGTILDVGLERFTRSGGELTYIGLENIKALAEVSITAMRDSPANSARTMRAAVFVDSGSGFVEQADSFSMTMIGAPANLSFQVPLNLTTDDIIKVQIKNEDTKDDIEVVDYNLTVKKS